MQYTSAAQHASELATRLQRLAIRFDNQANSFDYSSEKSAAILVARLERLNQKITKM